MVCGAGQLYKHTPQKERRMQDEEAHNYTVGRKETSDYAARLKASSDDHSPEKGAAVMGKSKDATNI